MLLRRDPGRVGSLRLESRRLMDTEQGELTPSIAAAKTLKRGFMGLPDRERIEVWLTFLVIAVTVMQAALTVRQSFPFTTDDAYITLRYARFLASGHGLRFNLGEAPVEGYSSFAFVMLGASAMKVGLDPVLVLKATGVLSLVGTAVLSYFVARRFVPRLAATLPPLFVTAYHGSPWWAVSGLETALAQLITISCVLLALTELDQGTARRAVCALRLPRLAVLGLLIALAGLVRPEGPLLFVVLGGGVVWYLGRTLWSGGASARHARRALGVFVATFGLPYGIYFAARALYFQRLLPNPIYCKAAYSGDPWQLILDVGHDFWPIIGLGLVALSRRDWRITLALSVPALQLAVLYGVDPIVGYHCRHFLPALAPLAVAGAVGAWTLFAKFGGLSLWRSSLAVLLGGALGPWPQPDKLHQDAVHYERRMRKRERLAAYLDERVQPNQWVILGDAGLVPFLSHAKYLDAYCLNSREMPLPPISFSPNRFAEFALGRQPEAIVVSSLSQTEMVPQPIMGVWPPLIRDRRLQEDYELATIIPTEAFVAYWVYLRRHR